MCVCVREREREREKDIEAVAFASPSFIFMGNLFVSSLVVCYLAQNGKSLRHSSRTSVQHAPGIGVGERWGGHFKETI